MKSSIRILNLEDNEDDAELSKAMLSARWPECHFVRVDSRGDYTTALEESSFDVILCDFTMPGFGGREALELTREKHPEVPFIFVSGTIGEDTAIEALKNGATDYVLKHRLMRLIPAVARALREAENRAECRRAEEVMRQSEHKYRELFESLSDAAFLADEQSGKIIDANRCAEAMLGRTRGYLLGRNHSQFLALDNAKLQAVTPAAAGPGLPVMASDILRADGKKIPVRVRISRLKLYGQALILLLCHEPDDCGWARSPA